MQQKKHYRVDVCGKHHEIGGEGRRAKGEATMQSRLEIVIEQMKPSEQQNNGDQIRCDTMR
jgi:hypothetical protein